MDQVDAFGMGVLFLVVNALLQALVFALGLQASTMLVCTLGFTFGAGFVFVRELLKAAKKHPMPKTPEGMK